MAKSFADLPIIETIQAAIRAEGYTIPTPIQLAAIPPLLEGRDLLGCAQTGTGKTAAFAIPILQLLAANPQKATPHYPRALILAPTRELAVQITESFDTYGAGLKLRCTSVFGGVGQASQVNAMKRGVHVLVATPGRLLDLMEQGQIYLDRLSYFVLDEADRMLDMGFMPSLKRIVRALPKKRQSIFLSATMPPPIEELASQLLHEHVSVMITPPATTAQRVTQRVMFVAKDDKRYLLEKLLEENSLSKVLVFTRTKHGADRLCKQLRMSGLAIDAIHGNKSQGARQRVLGELKNGKLRVLVATDVAARGIDVDAISHVINYEIPTDPESYVHRIGRTARAGETGESISFCDVDEVPSLRDIEKEIGQSIPIDRDQPYHYDGAERGSARGPKKPRVRGPRDRGARGPSESRGDYRGTKKTATSFAGGGANDGRAAESRSSEGQTEAPRRKRSISGKVKKVKTDTRKTYGFAHAKPKSSGKKRPPR
ncbi:MAG: DEAD/DEAH box helicase [Pirellulaceae bacterium]|nr:DEAD/DEAH box helicase [Pirellulaceae bacterium]